MTTIPIAPLAMWQVLPEKPGAPATADDVLRLGQTHLRFHDIAHYRVEGRDDRDWRGLVISGMSFMIAAAFFLMFVIDFGWRTRFWLAVMFLASLGIASVFEAAQIKGVRYRHLVVTDRSGQAHPFTCADANHMDVLLAVLHQRLGPPRTL